MVAKDRPIIQVSLKDFSFRKAEIAKDLWKAANEIGFFYLCDTGITEVRHPMKVSRSPRWYFSLLRPARITFHAQYQVFARKLSIGHCLIIIVYASVHPQLKFSMSL